MKIARNANFHTANVTIDRNLSLLCLIQKGKQPPPEKSSKFFGPKSHSHHSIIYSSTIQTKIFHQFIKEFRSSLSASKGMLSGHAVSVRDSSELLLTNPASELDENEPEEEEESLGKILYTASFEELAKSYLQYDTIIWVLISLLLVLAWGVGIIMLIYLPVRRYVLRKDISSRRLYVTPNDIVYKVSRPLFLPFLGVTKIEKRIPLRLVINIIMEQGCLQSIYGLHTFRVQSIAHGIAAPVDELQVQGVSNPECLRKVIVTEASKIKLVGRDWKKIMIEGPHDGRSASSNWKDGRGTIPAELVLHKLDEVNQSVKRIESIIGKPQAVPGSN